MLGGGNPILLPLSQRLQLSTETNPYNFGIDELERRQNQYQAQVESQKESGSVRPVSPPVRRPSISGYKNIGSDTQSDPFDHRDCSHAPCSRIGGLV